MRDHLVSLLKTDPKFMGPTGFEIDSSTHPD